MKERQTYSQCDSEKLNELLLGSLSPEETAIVESHLSECASCAEQIQLAAVTDTSWNEAQSMLALDEFDGLPSLSSAKSLFPAEVGDREYTPTADLLAREIRGWLDPTDDPQMLGRFAGYEIVGIIGHGGMGIVLKGFEASLNRYVAIKVLAPRLAANGAARQRFAREAQAAAAVLHDNVVAIHRVDEFHGLPFLVMPYIADISLQKRINDEGPLPLAAVLRIGSQIAAGLAAAHHQGLVHRDIKPANIMLEKGVERVTITDFGLARTVDDASLTKTGIIAGTPQYMSPEQARGESVGQRSDLFSLGSVLYTMCTGRAPFRGETSYGVLRRITDEGPKPIQEINPDIPEWLCQIIAKLMSRQPDDRFQSAQEVAGLLEECLAHVQQPDVVPLPASSISLCERGAKNQPMSASPRFLRKPTGSAVWLIAGAAVAFAMIFAGILIVLELNKGTVTIESDADVPVRITQGDKVVDELTVTRTGESVRIAAGRYQVELLAETDRLVVKNGTFTLTRGGEHVVTIQRVDASVAQAPSVPRAGPSESKLWNEFGVTPAPVSPLTAKVLEWIGLHLSPIPRERFRDKNVFAKYPGGLDVTGVRTHGPAEKAGMNGVGIVVGLQGTPIASLVALDSAMHDAIKQIERGDAEALQFEVLRSGKTVRVNVPFPVRELDLQATEPDGRSTSATQPAEPQPRKKTLTAPKGAVEIRDYDEDGDPDILVLDSFAKSLPPHALLFVTADWCAACQKLKPTVAKLKEKGVAIVEIDVTRHHNVSKALGVRELPTLIAWRNGQETARHEGYDLAAKKLRELEGVKDEPQPKTTKNAPKRVRHFTTGVAVETITSSPDGKLIAIANGNPTLIMRANRTSRVGERRDPLESPYWDKDPQRVLDNR